VEKFRIAQYGFIQMVALAYGLLGSGTIAKAAKHMVEGGPPPSPVTRALTFYHDYGIFLSLIIIGWAVFCAYHSSTFSRRNIGEDTIVISGLILAAIFLILGTILIFMTMGLLL
jgi:uncharacterized membrane protein